MLHLNIRKKMLLFCLFLLLVPSTVIATVSYYAATGETDILIRKNLENSVELMIQNMDQLNALVESGQLSLEQAQEQVKILMLGEKQADGTRPINPEIDLGENGYYYVLDEQGTLLAHPSIEGENLWDNKTSDGFYYIQDVIQQGLSGGGFTFYQWPLPGSEREATKITYALSYPEWGWIVVAGSYLQDYNTGETRILLTTAVTLVSCVVLGSLAIYLFSNHMARPLRAIAAAARRLAEGDLTDTQVAVRNRDEIGELAADFNRMGENLAAIVRQVVDSSEKVSQESQALQASIQEVTVASRQIAAATEQIASGMESQSISAEQSSRAMEELAAGIQRVAESSSIAHESSLHSEEVAKRGFDLISQAIGRMQAVHQSVSELDRMIDSLLERSQEIDQIVAAITNIASQTSLLSLNAAIEAARAGEQGKGFTVVANEVKKLAEMTKNSSEQISQLILSVQEEIAAASQSMTVSMEQFQEGFAVLEETGAAFENIMNAVNGVVGQIQDASAAAQQMSASAQEITASLQELDRIVNQSAEHAEEISASTEGQIASMEEIAQTSESLNQMASTLSGMVHRFKIAR